MSTTDVNMIVLIISIITEMGSLEIGHTIPMFTWRGWRESRIPQSLQLVINHIRTDYLQNTSLHCTAQTCYNSELLKLILIFSYISRDRFYSVRKVQGSTHDKNPVSKLVSGYHKIGNGLSVSQPFKLSVHKLISSSDLTENVGTGGNDCDL
jgi:hypothetical protein